MLEWRKVTKASEVAEGQRIRYCDRDKFSYAEGFGCDEDMRYFSRGISVNEEHVLQSSNPFKWILTEALFENGVPVCREPQKPAEVAAPVAPEIDDGGPASVMSVRDWFIGMALITLGASGARKPVNGVLSANACALADAVMKARAAK